MGFCKDEPLDLDELESEAAPTFIPVATPSPCYDHVGGKHMAPPAQNFPCATPSPRYQSAGSLRVARLAAVGGAGREHINERKTRPRWNYGLQGCLGVGAFVRVQWLLVIWQRSNSASEFVRRRADPRSK